MVNEWKRFGAATSTSWDNDDRVFLSVQSELQGLEFLESSVNVGWRQVEVSCLLVLPG